MTFKSKAVCGTVAAVALGVMVFPKKEVSSATIPSLRSNEQPERLRPMADENEAKSIIRNLPKKGIGEPTAEDYEAVLKWSQALATILTLEPSEALAELSKLPPETIASNQFRKMFGELFEEHSDVLISFAKTQIDQQLLSQLVRSTIVKNVGNTTLLDKLTTLVETLKEPQKSYYHGVLASKLADADAAAALAYVNAHSSGIDSERLKSGIAAKVAATDMNAGLKIASEISDLPSRASAYSEVLAVSVSQDPTGEKAKAILQSLDPYDALKVLMAGGVAPEKLAISSPDGVFSVLDKIAVTADNRESLIKVITSLSKKYPNEAFLYVAGDAALAGDSKALYELACRTAVKGDEFLMSQTKSANPAVRDAALKAAGAYTVLSKPSELNAKLATLSQEDRQVFATSALKPLVEFNTQKLAEEISSSGPLISSISPEEKAAVVSQTAGGLATGNPEKAATWASTLPENDRASAYAGIVNQGLKDNPVATGRWIQTLPAGTSRDAAVLAFVQGLEKTDPKTAAEFKASISYQNDGE
jgi:hypothetical protein